MWVCVCVQCEQDGRSRRQLAERGIGLLEEWGMLTVKSSDKSGGFSLKEVLHIAKALVR